MEGYETWEALKYRIMEVAPKLKKESEMEAFTMNDLARELDMNDASQKRQLSIAVNKLVNEGQLARYPGLSETLSIGRPSKN